MLLKALAIAVALSLAPQQDSVQRFEEVQLSIDMAPLGRLTGSDKRTGDGYRQAWWHAEYGKSKLRVTVSIYSNENYHVRTPEDVIDNEERHHDRKLGAGDRTTSDRKRKHWTFDSEDRVGETYGFVPYAILAEKDHAEAKPPETILYFAGAAQTHCYGIEIVAKPPLEAEARAELIEFLMTNVIYDGKVYNREWDEEEVVDRWRRHAPDDIADDLEIFRTKHFLIMTNSSGRKKFAKELEKSYDAVKALYPFEEREDLRLLPIYLFRTSEQFFEFYVKTLEAPRSEAESSKGVAYRDFYATWYESPKDPVHIHELTHQLFDNRLWLGGGGSWFQEGVAEYTCTSKNDRKEFKRLVKDGKYSRFEEFFTRESLLHASGEERLDGTDPGREAYLQAACIIEFVRESKWSKAKFQEFVHAVGKTRRGSLPEIEAALQEVFGVGVDGFEEQFVEYWKKR